MASSPSSNDHATHLQVASVISFYMSAALVMVFVNKAVLNGSPDLPLLFLLIQLLMAVVLLHAAALFSPKVVIPKIEMAVAKKLVPVVAVNVIGLVFNTLCLRDVEASFFQIARGLNLPITIIVSSIHTRSLPSTRVIVAAVAVTLGFFTGVTPSKDLPAKAVPSILSLVYGVLSSLFIAFHAVLIKYSLQHCNNSSIELAYWTNFGSAVFLLPFVAFGGELFKFRALLYTLTWDGRLFFWGSMTTGVFGFLLCVAGVLSIKVTSPITHMFSGAVRSVLQTLLGVWIFNDILTINRATSIMIILGGTMFYTWVKSVEATPPKPHTRSIDLESNSIVDKDSNEETVVWESSKEKYPPQ
jgi:GDP-fucose transporter C1